LKKIKWISRHPLPAEALEALAKELNVSASDIVVDAENILFPADADGAYAALKEAAAGYDAVGFVAPAQLTAALLRAAAAGRGLGTKGFFVISVPKMAPDGITRTFVFDHIEVFDM